MYGFIQRVVISSTSMGHMSSISEIFDSPCVRRPFPGNIAVEYGLLERLAGGFGMASGTAKMLCWYKIRILRRTLIRR